MTRTVLLGLLGLALAVAVGFGVHLLTRSTIALPVVTLEPPAAPAATTARSTTAGDTDEGGATVEAPTAPPVSTEAETDDDSSGRGRGRGRGGNSGPGGGEDDD